jgi:hypothetical protein
MPVDLSTTTTTTTTKRILYKHISIVTGVTTRQKPYRGNKELSKGRFLYYQSRIKGK